MDSMLQIDKFDEYGRHSLMEDLNDVLSIFLSSKVDYSKSWHFDLHL